MNTHFLQKKEIKSFIVELAFYVVQLLQLYCLIHVCQAITILVKNVKSNEISETQLQVLLGYAEEDIYDQSRQATAFGLLKVTGGAQVKMLSRVVEENHLPSCVLTCDL